MKRTDFHDNPGQGRVASSTQSYPLDIHHLQADSELRLNSRSVQPVRAVWRREPPGVFPGHNPPEQLHTTPMITLLRTR
ncbi:hypothetical protein AOLI_G00131910 [Acnodon oligacanthus]